ncbi:LLM class F420-dependent oxidoreductase [Nonomuraea pusilla]|uniref:Probable F420-dependent oxidoreductase, Rv3093c family n=1 Tax=Nonomuraea pusilla TaxID=46177 RepID=A0A1H7YIT0_9ACTN|nr:LLM class F420-dependent oxidoreductase [Nonomuraea pusilla]SEM45744.1 probable F420-dependent oxidoreductase, Rv3093c family [Nonomuraea pusilla]
MNLSVSLGLWQDRPAEEALLTARAADELGYPTLWVGEMATYDAFALATAIGLATARIGLTVGPLAVAVRDPMMIAMGAASVASLTGRQVDVAVGTSSPTVVESWHGRSRARSATALRETVQVLRPLLDGDRSGFTGACVSSTGYRLRLPAPRSRLAVAAFGPSAVRTAASADRMVLNLVTPASAARLTARLRAVNPDVPVTAWVTAAADPDREAVDRVRRAVVGYLPAPGYGEMFAEAGFGDVVAFARTRPHPRDLLAAVPDELVASVSLLGDPRAQLAAYAAAGVDEVAVVPVGTDRDPGGAATLASLAAR